MGAEGEGGLQVPEGGRRQGGGAGQEEEGAEAGAQLGEEGLGPGQGRPPREGVTQAPHQTRTPPDREAAASNHFLSFILVPIHQMFKCSIMFSLMTRTYFVLMKIRQLFIWGVRTWCLEVFVITFYECVVFCSCTFTWKVK